MNRLEPYHIIVIYCNSNTHGMSFVVLTSFHIINKIYQCIPNISSKQRRYISLHKKLAKHIFPGIFNIKHRRNIRHYKSYFPLKMKCFHRVHFIRCIPLCKTKHYILYKRGFYEIFGPSSVTEYFHLNVLTSEMSLSEVNVKYITRFEANTSEN